MNRRDFSKLLLATGTSALASRGLPVSAQQGTDQTYDLLIQGGTVIDPGQRLHAVMDVAVKGKKIFAVAQDFPASRARNVISAKDRIVTPGFVDLHVHVTDVGGVNADHYCLSRGSTTVVDAGSAGPGNIEEFVKHVVQSSITKVHPLVSIAGYGGRAPSDMPMDDLRKLLDPQVIADAAQANRPAVVGIKGRVNRDYYKDHHEERESLIMKVSVEAAKLARLPLMVHINNTFHPLPDILNVMRKGDVFTHVFNGYDNGILDANGRILPAVREARQRGVLFDVGAAHHNYLSFDVAEKALQQDFLPDSISSDVTDVNVDTVVFDLPTMASKFLALGMTLDQVIERVTVKPAQVFDFGPIGTLKPGNDADIGIFELRTGNYKFVDVHQTDGKRFPAQPGEKPYPVRTREGHQLLVNKAVVCRGQLFVNQAEL